MSKCLELKIDPGAFQAVVDGKKTFEIRYNDRDYKTGDILILCETKYTGEEMKKGKPLEYTGRITTSIVTHALYGPAHGLAAGWAILSINGDSAIKDLYLTLKHALEVKSQYYSDICKYKKACTDLVNEKEFLHTSIKKRDAQIAILIQALLDHCTKDCNNTKRPFNCDHEECTTYRALLTGPTEAYELALKQRKGAGHCG